MKVLKSDMMEDEREIDPLWRDACAVIVRDIVAEAFDITPERILSRQRGREYIARARQVAMYLMHTLCSFNLTEVGVAFERERSTVAYACNKVEDMRDDEYVDIQLDLLAEQIKKRLDEIRLNQNHEAWTQPLVSQKVVGGQNLQEEPIIRTQKGKLMVVKFLN